MVDKKEAVALGAMLSMGVGIAYLLKEELIESDRVTKKNEKENSKSEIKHNPQNDGLSGIALHNVSWQYLREMYNNKVPKMDMLYIYPLLTVEFKTRWRRGIYNFGASTVPDRLFVVHDSYSLTQDGFPELGNALSKYTNHNIGFEELLQEYKKAIRKITK